MIGRGDSRLRIFVIISVVTATMVVYLITRRADMPVVESHATSLGDATSPSVLSRFHYFGVAAAGTDDECEFKFRNTTTAELVLTPGACTNFISFESWEPITIPINQTASIKLQYHFRSDHTGEYRQRAQLHSSDPRDDFVELHVVGIVR